MELNVKMLNAVTKTTKNFEAIYITEAFLGTNKVFVLTWEFIGS